MRSGARLRLLVVGGLSLALAACAAVPPGPPVAAPVPLPPPPAPPPVSAPVEPAPPTPIEVLAASHREKGQAFERAGRLRQALDEWKIALTINPGDAAAREGLKKLEGQLERGVTDRVRQGREALGRGDHVEARRHFLAALTLDPANRTAFEALQTEVKEIRFVMHTVSRGETLATIAELYYGDRARSEVIWETNQLPPNPRLAAGTVLRVPEIPGVPFVHPDFRPKLPSPAAAAAPAAPKTEGGKTDGGKGETPEINPLLVGAKEALEKGEYVAALADVDKVLTGNARDLEGVDLKKAILYGLGKSQLGQRRYDESYRTLTQLAKLAPGYQDSGALLQQSRERLIQYHYGQGLRLYQEERLEPAIAQWRTVLEYDSQHANAKKNIEQAERLLKSLQQRQQPKKP